MKFTISPEEQYITLQDTAEVILARHVVDIRLGTEHELTKRLGKLVRTVIDASCMATQSHFSGEDQQAIVEALHGCAVGGEDSWRQAQAAHMLESAL